MDDRGQSVAKIPRDSFRVFEDGMPQRISDFHVDNGETVAVVVLIQTSVTSQNLNEIVGAAARLIDMRPTDYTAIITFDLRPSVVTDFTLDRTVSHKAINILRVSRLGSRTSLMRSKTLRSA